MKKIGLAGWILIALVAGAVTGFVVGPQISFIKPVGTVFLRLLKMTIYPLVFFSIAGGIASIADLNRLKKVGATFMGYWIVASCLAAGSGIMWSYIIRPGDGITMPAVETKTISVDLLDSLVKWIPDNVGRAFADGNMLQIIIFSIFLGISISLISNTKGGQMLSTFFNGGADAMGRMIKIILKMAPFGVFALISNVTGTLGALALQGIGKMLLTQYLAYLTVIVVFYPLILKFLAKVNPLQHFKNVYPAMALAFSTQSASGTLPMTMECTRDRGGVPDDMVNLIAPPAATINAHACAAEMAIYAIFASQLYGIHLGFVQLLTIIALGVVMAAGVAGVPGGGIVMSAVLLQIMGLPMEIVGWIAGVYILIDMPNTMLNVTGDTVGMVYTASRCGDLDIEVYNQPNS
ncbi:dicarboxylate/amino acid:cation symporter [Desulfoluna sp.]|uniref:dicarboxylate/amino acid:cation symporter n=1 Tax=Desulfoluna sp. TaxID=2045199 RepID=UPI002631BA21|nr:dicarboxylate/amino acid:cation symporter [Desulfoluna sp.]